MDDLKVKEGYSFNGSTLRRALKSLVNENFSQCKWTELVTETKNVIDKRFIVDTDKVSANDFFGMTCCQILQKLLRTATQKFKPKDRNSIKSIQMFYNTSIWGFESVWYFFLRRLNMVWCGLMIIMFIFLDMICSTHTSDCVHFNIFRIIRRTPSAPTTSKQWRWQMRSLMLWSMPRSRTHWMAHWSMILTMSTVCSRQKRHQLRISLVRSKLCHHSLAARLSTRRILIRKSFLADSWLMTQAQSNKLQLIPTNCWTCFTLFA